MQRTEPSMQRAGVIALPPHWGRLPVQIPTPANARGQPPTPWDRLQFSPIGAYHLRCWQGVFPGVKNFFIASQARFRSADIAWFCSGSSRDSNHIHSKVSFHPSLVTLVKDTNLYTQGKSERKSLLAELKDLMFDTATMYDRLTGSTSMIISSGGTTVPGTPTRPEYLKASVYLPPAFVAHNDDLHGHLIDIVQHYIETVGIRTVSMWTQRARHDLGYSLTQPGNPHKNASFNAIPNTDHISAHYTFLGQPYRFVQDPLTSSVQPPSPDSSVASYDFGEDPDPTTILIVDLQQKIYDLEQQVMDADMRNFSLSTNFKRAEERIVSLETQLQSSVANRSISTPDSTPLRNVIAHGISQPASSTYRHVTPSRVHLTQAQTPSGYRSPDPQTPETPSRHRVQSSSGVPAVSHRLQLGKLTVPRSIQKSPCSSRTAHDELASSHEPLLPHFINLYSLHHVAAQLELISNYTPAENRTQELLKLGLGEKVCDALRVAMTVDNGMDLQCSGMHNNE